MFHLSSVGRRLALTLLSLTVAGPTLLSAQARTQITPFFGAFFAPLPYGKDIDQGAGVLGDERLTNAPAIGIRASFPLKSSIGFEAQASYVFTGRQVKVSGTPPVGFFIPGNAFMASGRFTLHPRRSNFRGILGFGYQKLGGDAWNESNFGGGASFDPSSFGGILGFGVRANVTPRMAVDITVESYLHSSDPAGFGSKEFQADIMLTVGIPIGLGGK